MTPQALQGLAPAKVNLTLRVTGLRADGYHLLESLVVFAGVGDRLRVEPATGLSLRVSGPRAAGVPEDDSNLVLKAARRLADLRGLRAGARISLEKHLPHGGGIGGGSSDAATAVRALARLWGVAPLSAAEALPLGADVPVCLGAPAPHWMGGIGELLHPVPALPPGWLVLVNPGVAMPTPQVFRAFDATLPPAPPTVPPTVPPTAPPILPPVLPEALDFVGFAAWLAGQNNDLATVLTAPDSPVYLPQISAILAALAALPGCAGAKMSGSGSTCWGVFATEPEARAAARVLGRAHPDWWVAAAPILSEPAGPDFAAPPHPVA